MEILDKVDVVVEAKNDLGEGPTWDPVSARLYWLDITKQELHYFKPASGEHGSITLGYMPGSIHLTGDEYSVVLTSVDGLMQVNLYTGVQENLGRPYNIPDGVRFNDGKTDYRGRIWAGTMALNFERGAGVFMRISDVMHGKVILDHMTIPNGLAWTSDRKTLFHIDSPELNVQAYPFTGATGELGPAVTVMTFDDDGSVPDGMCIDTEGMLWIAFFNGGRVRRYDPDSGQLLATVVLPAAQITSCCLGGEDMGDLYITSARTGLDEAQLRETPFAGALLRVRPGTTGVTEPFCKIKEALT